MKSVKSIDNVVKSMETILMMILGTPQKAEITKFPNLIPNLKTLMMKTCSGD